MRIDRDRLGPWDLSGVHQQVGPKVCELRCCAVHLTISRHRSGSLPPAGSRPRHPVGTIAPGRIRWWCASVFLATPWLPPGGELDSMCDSAGTGLPGRAKPAQSGSRRPRTPSLTLDAVHHGLDGTCELVEPEARRKVRCARAPCVRITMTRRTRGSLRRFGIGPRGHLRVSNLC
jgi:hypothetical protein